MSQADPEQQRRPLIEPVNGSSAFSLSPFKAKNSLVGHPLFEPGRLTRLLRTLPREQVEIRAVQSLDNNDGSYVRGALLKDADPVKVFERLDEKPAWMLLHHTWIHDPEYAALVAQYMRDLQERVEGVGQDISDLGCWIFLSSGRCVVHFHADPDQSFLNQIRGSKTVFVYPTTVVPEPAIEKLVYTLDQGTVTYRPDYENAMFPAVHLDPGETVFLPLYAPHRVINDEGSSISINFGFHTRTSRRRRRIHMVNLELRQLGIQPNPYNRSVVTDSMKEWTHWIVRAKNKFLKRLRPEVVV